MRSLKRFFQLILFSVLVSCGPEKPDIPAAPLEEKPKKITPVISFSVVAKYPHDTTAYTEGLLFHEGKLFESTGAPSYLPQTRSAVGIVDLKSGKFDKKIEIDKSVYFGEGITILNNKLYQLTYTNQVGFVYDMKNFNSLGQFGFQNKEGWGMTTEGKHLIFSDGTCNLTYMDPKDFKVTRTLPVVENGYGVYALNELEYIKGYIYANVWMTNKIVKIDPSTGEILGELDLTSVFNEAKSKSKNLNELNGIAYDSIADRIMITGKLWPETYEISFPH
jgi:glutamine cyclotransferase